MGRARVRLPLLAVAVALILGASVVAFSFHSEMIMRHVLMSWERSKCGVSNILASHPANCEVVVAKAEYRALGTQFENDLSNYRTFGSYLNYGRKYWGDQSVDEYGVPMITIAFHHYYNPVNVANYALSMYDRSLRGDTLALNQFYRATDRLLLLQDERGALLYNYRWKYYLAPNPYSPGWISGMAQGVALSVFARAYHVTGDPKYLAAGNKAFDFLTTPVARGGVSTSMADLDPALASFVFIDEFPARPSGYTLNGFMVAVLGLYDWSQVPGQRSGPALDYFRRTIETLDRILPFYDMGGFTSYDLGHLTHHGRTKAAAEYHAVHIVLLYALASVTHDPVLQKYETLWASYVSN
jgi:hypothetical protein